MARALSLFLCIALLSLPSGCIAVSSHEGPCRHPGNGERTVFDNLSVRTGDTHMLRDEYREALDSYISAQRLHPEFNACEAFRSRIQRAKSMIAYQQGNAFRKDEEWDEAIRSYSEALAADPRCDVADEARNATRGQASTACYEKALLAVRNRDDTTAISLLQQALNYNCDNQQAAAMLDILSKKVEAAARGDTSPAAAP